MYFDSQNKINPSYNPIDYIEEQIYKLDVDFFRDSPNHLNLNYRGQWRCYNVSVKGLDYLTEEQINDILNVVIHECDKYFPAFYLFFFKKQDPKFALSASLIETNGRA